MTRAIGICSIVVLVASCDYFLVAWNNEHCCREKAIQREMKKLQREYDSLDAAGKKDEAVLRPLWAKDSARDVYENGINTINS